LKGGRGGWGKAFFFFFFLVGQGKRAEVEVDDNAASEEGDEIFHEAKTQSVWPSLNSSFCPCDLLLVGPGVMFEVVSFFSN
jgi:hypothetical protein